jgi:hypothetical protein
MRHALPTAVLLCALLAGCSTVHPDWSWPGERAQVQPAPIPAVVAVSPATLEDACHAQAWQHRLDILGDERLSYGQAYRRCMEQQAASTTRSVAPAAVEARSPAPVARPARSSRN